MIMTTFRIIILPNSRFNQNLEGSIFAWLFVVVVVVVETLRLSRQEQTRLGSDQTILDKARPDQTRPDLLDTIVHFPDTMVKMATNGCKWLQMAANGCKRLQKAAHGCKWLQMAENGCKRLHMAVNGCK